MALRINQTSFCLFCIQVVCVVCSLCCISAFLEYVMTAGFAECELTQYLLYLRLLVFVVKYLLPYLLRTHIFPQTMRH